MADGDNFQPHCISMKALGRHFKLGNFYNYLNDGFSESKVITNEYKNCGYNGPLFNNKLWLVE